MNAIEWMDQYYESGGPCCDRCDGNYYDSGTNAGWCIFAEQQKIELCLASIPAELLTDEQITKRLEGLK